MKYHFRTLMLLCLCFSTPLVVSANNAELLRYKDFTITLPDGYCDIQKMPVYSVLKSKMSDARRKFVYVAPKCEWIKALIQDQAPKRAVDLFYIGMLNNHKDKVANMSKAEFVTMVKELALDVPNNRETKELYRKQVQTMLEDQAGADTSSDVLFDTPTLLSLDIHKHIASTGTAFYIDNEGATIKIVSLESNFIHDSNAYIVGMMISEVSANEEKAVLERHEANMHRFASMNKTILDAK